MYASETVELPTLSIDEFARAGAGIDVDFTVSDIVFPSLSFFNRRSICPISLLGSMILRTRFFSSFVSGNPPSVLRSQRRVFVGAGFADVVDGSEAAASLAWRMVIVNIPPVTGTRLMLPMLVLKVWRSSWANWWGWIRLSSGKGEGEGDGEWIPRMRINSDDDSGQMIRNQKSERDRVSFHLPEWATHTVGQVLDLHMRLVDSICTVRRILS